MRVLGKHLDVHRALRGTAVWRKQVDGFGNLTFAVIPDAHGTPQDRPHRTHQRAAGQDEVRGHHQIQIRTRGDAVGVEPIQRRLGGPLLEQRYAAKVVRDEMHAAVEFCDATGRHAVGRAHLCDQESAVFKGHEVVGHARFHGFGRE